MYFHLWFLSINMLSIAELDPFRLLVEKCTVLTKLNVASKASSC